MLLLSACQPARTGEADELSHTNNAQHALSVTHAIGFDLDYRKDFRILHIFNHYQQEKDTISYLLLSGNTSIPPEYSNYRVIHAPVERIITMSSTHLALIEALGKQQSVIGHSNANNIYSKTFLDRVADGSLQEVGRDGSLNVERALALNPGVVMAVGLPGNNNSTYSILEDAGIPVIYNAEWQETSLLGRSEWIKVMAALLNREDVAEHKFNEITRAYDSLRMLASSVTVKPFLIGNTPIKGTWHVPGGNSYIARLINDAGGDYYWKNTRETGSIVVSFEDVFQAGLNADLWINARVSKSKQEILDIDPRLKDFKAFKTGAIYNFTRRQLESGANDYWETGMTHPQYVLADMIRIIHPELLPGYELFFYEKLK